MRKFEKIAAQGDLLIICVDEIPADVVETKPNNGRHILAHSETGHHHTVSADHVTVLERPGFDFMAWLNVDKATVLEHERSFDTHEALEIPPGNYEIRRQREHTPEGYRRAAD